MIEYTHAEFDSTALKTYIHILIEKKNVTNPFISFFHNTTTKVTT